jgi:pilus assembly protein FimV
MIHADTSGGRFAALRRAVAHPSLGGAAALGFALSASWSDPALAAGLGPVTEQSALGRSLRVVVPIIVAPGEDIGAECFRLAASEREMEGVPQLAFGRMSLERTADGARLVITNAAPVSDPVVRMTVQTGCDAVVRREYVLLMDPPPIETPVVAAERTPRTEVAQASETRPVATPPRRPRTSAGRATTGAAEHGAGAPARSAAKPAPPRKARSSAKAAPKPPARAAGNQPRLTVSAAAPLSGANAQAGTSGAEQARVQQELANAMEAETVVLQRRIVELTAMVERMQEELRATEAAQRAAEQAKAPDPPPAKASSWSDQNWPLLSAVAGLPLLVALGLLWRRRSQRDGAAESPRTRLAPVAAPAPEAGAPSVEAETSLRNIAAGMVEPTVPAVAPPPRARVPRRTTAARDSASALAVSELLHVTEEARVYVALGRPERAIDVLNEHIHQAPRSVPAAWLMLLDLYHARDRRQDFRRLAEEFHLHCNVQAPLWDSFGLSEHGEEGGLETFPHIQREVTRIWRQPGCREYLERLLYDNREGRRMGFPLAAYGEILLLLQILDAPPPVDIDSDLVQSGKLEPIPNAVVAGTAPADPPPPAESVRRGRDRAPDAAQSPAQRPLDLEPDRGAAARARKSSS